MSHSLETIPTQGLCWTSSRVLSSSKDWEKDLGIGKRPKLLHWKTSTITYKALRLTLPVKVKLFQHNQKIASLITLPNSCLFGFGDLFWRGIFAWESQYVALTSLQCLWRSGWSWTPKDPRASASQGLVLKATIIFRLKRNNNKVPDYGNKGTGTWKPAIKQQGNLDIK